MSKKICKTGTGISPKNKKARYQCAKCGEFGSKEKQCCKPVFIIRG